jgi:phage terminase large subunit
MILTSQTKEQETGDRDFFVGRFAVDESHNQDMTLYRVYCDGRWSGWHRRVLDGINEVK